MKVQAFNPSKLLRLNDTTSTQTQGQASSAAYQVPLPAISNQNQDSTSALDKTSEDKPWWQQTVTLILGGLAIIGGAVALVLKKSSPNKSSPEKKQENIPDNTKTIQPVKPQENKLHKLKLELIGLIPDNSEIDFSEPQLGNLKLKTKDLTNFFFDFIETTKKADDQIKIEDLDTIMEVTVNYVKELDRLRKTYTPSIDLDTFINVFLNSSKDKFEKELKNISDSCSADKHMKLQEIEVQLKNLFEELDDANERLNQATERLYGDDNQEDSLYPDSTFPDNSFSSDSLLQPWHPTLNPYGMTTYNPSLPYDPVKNPIGYGNPNDTNMFS